MHTTAIVLGISLSSLSTFITADISDESFQPGEPYYGFQGELPPLHQAAKKGDLKAAQKLLAQGADVNEHDPLGDTPLILASGQGPIALVKALLSKGADVNGNNCGATALHQAARFNNAPIVRLLLAHGADINARGWYQMTPLYEAINHNGIVARDGHMHRPSIHARNEVIQLFIAKGADVNIGNDELDTPLHQAAYDRNVYNVQLLITHGANVNARCIYGFTPLHGAARVGNVEVVKALIHAGADVTLKKSPDGYPCEGYEDKTALEIAQHRLKGLESEKRHPFQTKQLRRELIKVIQILEAYQSK